MCVQVEVEVSISPSSPLTFAVCEIEDRVLDGVAKACQKHVRVIDTFARLGGEEFAILLPETDLSTAQNIASRLLSYVAELEFEQDDNSKSKPIAVTISLGLASLGRGDNSLSRVLSRADEALYHAKEAGRNQIFPMS